MVTRTYRNITFIRTLPGLFFLRDVLPDNILHEIRKWKANWIGHILRRNCLLQQVVEGKIKGQIEVTRRRGRMRKKLLDDLKDRRGYCQLKEEALDRTMWRNRFGRGFGPVVWQITDDVLPDAQKLGCSHSSKLLPAKEFGRKEEQARIYVKVL